jgi:hypothetical protein
VAIERRQRRSLFELAVDTRPDLFIRKGGAMTRAVVVRIGDPLDE